MKLKEVNLEMTLKFVDSVFCIFQYFVDYKLGEANTTDSRWYQANFFPFLSFASQIPNVFFNWLNIFVQLG